MTPLERNGLSGKDRLLNDMITVAMLLSTGDLQMGELEQMVDAFYDMAYVHGYGDGLAAGNNVSRID